MKKLYCVIAASIENLEKPKVSHISEKILFLSNIYSKCKNEDEKLFKEEEPIEILKILRLISKRHKTVCRVLNYIEHLLIIISAITGCISISDFASLVGISVGITSSATEVKICVITAGMK